jgi:hypothetical protein
MSKEHKMTYDGKKYVTKISNIRLCDGCVFSKVLAIEDSYKPLYMCKLHNNNRGCISTQNKDGKSRIWVEDTPKTKKDYVWVIELYQEGIWVFFGAETNRRLARKEASSIRNLLFYRERKKAKTRIRKYIPAK